MGLLDDYQIDMDEVEVTTGFKSIPDDTYQFAVGDAYIRTIKAKSGGNDVDYLLINYLLADEEGVATGDSFDEWFGLPQDPTARTKREDDALGRYKARLLSLGIAPEDVNSVGTDELVGIRGVFTLVSSTAKDGKVYQNIRGLSLSDVEDETEEEAEEDAPKPVAKAPVRKATATPAAGGKANPFANRK